MNIPIITPVVDWMRGRKKVEDIDLPQPMPPPDFSHLLSPQFAEERFKAEERMREIESKQNELEAIEKSNLSRRCKDAFQNFIISNYDQAVMLSNLTKPHLAEMAFINSIITQMASVISNAKKSDRAKPAYITFTRHTRDKLWFILSRTVGIDDRERVIAAVMRVRYDSAQRLSPTTISNLQQGR